MSSAPLPRLAMAFLLCLATPLAAETPAQGFAKAAGTRATPSKLEFHDDPTDVTGKAWEFTKALIGASGVEGFGNAVDAVDFVKAGESDGYSPELVLTTAAKVVSANFSTKRAEELVGKLGQKEIFDYAKVIGLAVDPEDVAKSTKDIQRKLVEYMVETAPTVAVTAGSEGGLSAGHKLFLEVMGKACPPCDAAYKGYDLAAESARAFETAFENLETQKLFGDMAKSGWYREDEFKTYFTGNDAIKTEARKALEKMWEAAGKSGTPSDDDVMGFVYGRFERWQKEVADKKVLDAQMARIEPLFTSLSQTDKRWMYGDADEATWAEKYIADSLSLWKDAMGLKGNAPWPLGLGQKDVEAQLALLIKRMRMEGLSEAQIQWELRTLAAGWGWISKDKIGPKPETPRTEVERGIARRLPTLSITKLEAVLANAGVKPSADFLNCLCPNGFHYYNGADAKGPCRRIGSLGGVSWAGIDGRAIESCSASYPLADGRRVVGALADRLIEVRKAQRQKP